MIFFYEKHQCTVYYTGEIYIFLQRKQHILFLNIDEVTERNGQVIKCKTFTLK